MIKNLYKRFYQKNWNIENFFSMIVNAEFFQLEFMITKNTTIKPVEIRYRLINYICDFIYERMNLVPNIPPHYGLFLEHCLKQDNMLGFISFNYDWIVDRLLFNKEKKLNYCLKRDDNIISHKGIESIYKGVKILKLHGSLNWMLCEKCNRMEIYNEFEGFRKKGFCTNSGCNGRLVPFIVPPVWNKNVYLDRLQVLWKEAIILLEKAEKIIIIGYSFPPLDLYSIDLIRLAIELNLSVEITVVNGKSFDYEQLQRRIKHKISATSLYFHEYLEKEGILKSESTRTREDICANDMGG